MQFLLRVRNRKVAGGRCFEMTRRMVVFSAVASKRCLYKYFTSRLGTGLRRPHVALCCSSRYWSSVFGDRVSFRATQYCGCVVLDSASCTQFVAMRTFAEHMISAPKYFFSVPKDIIFGTQKLIFDTNNAIFQNR